MHRLRCSGIFGSTGKTNGRPGLWLAETFSTSPLKRLNRIQRNLTGSKLSMPSTTFVFKANREKKTKMAALASDWLRNFRLLWNCERNSTKLDRKQDLNALYQVCVFQVDRKNKMATLAYDLLRHFQLFLWNRWIEFNKNRQEARCQHPLPGLRFRADQKNKIAALSSDWLRHFWLLLWNHWTEFNETWQKASSQRLPSPGLWLAETYFDFFSETAERNSAKLDRKQALNVLYQVCVFRAEKRIIIATLANPSKKVAHCTQVHVMGLWASCLWIYEVRGGGVHQFMYMYGTHSLY